jgi:hypothetical protein
VRKSVKLDGIARVYVRAERAALARSADPLDRRAYRSWHAGNGGDLLVVTDPYWLDTETVATTHGSPYDYDTHVPMVLVGAGITPGRYDRTVAVADLAPTLARVLGVTAPDVQARSAKRCGDLVPAGRCRRRAVSASTGKNGSAAYHEPISRR